MSEALPPRIQPVSARTLRCAIIRLDARKYPLAMAAIDRELTRRAAETRKAAA